MSGAEDTSNILDLIPTADKARNWKWPDVAGCDLARLISEAVDEGAEAEEDPGHYTRCQALGKHYRKMS